LENGTNHVKSKMSKRQSIFLTKWICYDQPWISSLSSMATCSLQLL